MVGRSAEKDGEGVDRATKHLCSVRPECTHMRCGGSVMAWVCMAGNVTGTLVFIDDADPVTV